MRLARPGISISAFVLLSAGLCLGQSLGDMARQERERRSRLPKHAAVITNEDLSKDQIFSAPDDAEQAAARNTPEAVPQGAAAPAANVPLWGVAEQPGFSMGEYARKLREHRRQRERQAALTQQPASPPATTPVVIPGQEQSPFWTQHRASASQGEPVPATPQSHIAQQTGLPLIRVERGDSLWKLARRHYGAGRLWRLLWQANPEIRRPNRLSVGLMLRQPSDESLAIYRGHKSAPRIEAASVSHRGKVLPTPQSTGARTAVHGPAGMSQKAAASRRRPKPGSLAALGMTKV